MTNCLTIHLYLIQLIQLIQLINLAIASVLRSHSSSTRPEASDTWNKDVAEEYLLDPQNSETASNQTGNSSWHLS